MSYPPNLPQEVQEKVALLSEYQKQITSLESQLQMTRAAHNQLQGELLKYRITLATDASSISVRFGIGKLPNEMLLHIFEHFLSDNHRHIRILLAVCKRWNHIVMQSARLWARIRLAPTQFRGYQNSEPSSVLYIEACLKHSQSLLLDIEIDYESFRYLDDYIREELESTVLRIADKDEEDHVFEWVINLDCDFVSEEYHVYARESLEELGVLVGVGGKHMERWQSLDLRLPSWRGHGIALDVWAKLVGCTPNLQLVKIAELETILDATYPGDEAEEFSRGLPSLSGLLSLTLDDPSNNHLHLLSISPPALQHLDTYYYNHSPSKLSDISLFAHLRKLSLRAFRIADEEVETGHQERSDPLFFVKLPQLQEFNLFGTPPILKHGELDFPSLKELQLCSYNAFHLHPSLSPAHIRWSVTTPKGGYWTPENICSSLETLLQSSSRIEVVTVGEIARAYVPGVLLDLKQASSLPASLKTIAVELVNGGREFIGVS